MRLKVTKISHGKEHAEAYIYFYDGTRERVLHIKKDTNPETHARWYNLILGAVAAEQAERDIFIEVTDNLESLTVNTLFGIVVEERRENFIPSPFEGKKEWERRDLN